MEPTLSSTQKEDAEVYDFFRIGVVLKGVQGLSELVSGLLIFFIPLGSFVAFADHFTDIELAKDPSDFVAIHLAEFVHHLSVGTKDFTTAYLLINGVIKLGLAVALLSGKKWAYPVALVALGGFITYLFYRIYLHHSPVLAAITLLDILVFYFIFREYAIVERKK